MKRKKIGVIGAVVLFFCAAILVFANNNNDSNSRLTEKQINDLRTEYPICYGEPSYAETTVPSLDEVIDRVDTFVYGKVVGEVSYYYRDISTGNEMLDKKRVETGLTNTYEFYEYTLEVISDTQDVINTPQITIARNAELENYSPVLKDGMKVLIPVGRKGQSEGKPLRYLYMKYGFYYVTEDGYVLSAFNEDSKTKKSGIQVDSLMKQLKQKKDDMLKSAADTDEASE